MSLARNLFWLITGILLSLFLFLWQEHPAVFFADSVGNIIREGSGGEIDRGSQDQNLPSIPGNDAEEKIDRALLTLINIVLYMCGTIAGVMIIVGGIRYLVSSGSDDAMSSAKKTILWACGGLLMTVLAWAIVLNIVRIGSLDERLDYSENPVGGACGPNVVMACGGVCCGCASTNSGNVFGCDAGLQCGGPLDVTVFAGIDEIEDTIRVCQPPPAE